MFITDGDGYIGSHLIEELSKNNKIKVLKKRSKEIISIFFINNKIKKTLYWQVKYQNLDLIIKRCLKWEKKISNGK